LGGCGVLGPVALNEGEDGEPRAALQRFAPRGDVEGDCGCKVGSGVGSTLQGSERRLQASGSTYRSLDTVSIPRGTGEHQKHN